MSSDPNEQRFLWPTQEDIASSDAVINCAFTAPVSTRVLSNAQSAYAVWRDEEARLRADELHLTWVEGEVATDLYRRVELGEITGDSVRSRSLKEHVRFKMHAEQELEPASISPALLPYVVRAARAYSLAGYLTPEEQQKVDDHTFDTPVGRHNVSGLVVHYNTASWVEKALTDSDYAVIQSQQRLLSDTPYEQQFRAQETQFRQEAVLRQRREQRASA